jgi:hypothetical protein
MRKRFWLLSVVLAGLVMLAETAPAQVRWVVGGRLGMSLYSTGGGGGGTYYNFYTGRYEEIGGTSSTSAGLQIGPMGEVIFSKQFAIGMELNINTQGGTPIEWASYFKTYFQLTGSSIKPYAHAGFSLFFYTGGPYFCIFAGGGANFPIAPKLYIPADLKLGPVFSSGSTTFYLAVTSGIRYEI